MGDTQRTLHRSPVGHLYGRPPLAAAEAGPLATGAAPGSGGPGLPRTPGEPTVSIYEKDGMFMEFLNIGRIYVQK